MNLIVSSDKANTSPLKSFESDLMTVYTSCYSFIPVIRVLGLQMVCVMMKPDMTVSCLE